MILGKKSKTQRFSTPVTIIGWSELVPAGAEFKTFNTKVKVLNMQKHSEQKKKIYLKWLTRTKPYYLLLSKPTRLAVSEAIRFEIKN